MCVQVSACTFHSEFIVWQDGDSDLRVVYEHGDKNLTGSCWLHHLGIFHSIEHFDKRCFLSLSSFLSLPRMLSATSLLHDTERNPSRNLTPYVRLIRKRIKINEASFYRWNLHACHLMYALMFPAFRNFITHFPKCQIEPAASAITYLVSKGKRLNTAWEPTKRVVCYWPSHRKI